MSKALSAAEIFAAQDLSEDYVTVPEWGGDVRLKQMTAFETMAMTKDMDAPENKGLGMYVILVHTARNEDDSHLFTVDDIEKLKLKNFNVLNRLQTAALKLNRMGSGVDLKKALSEAGTVVSPTDSPKN